jgi:hypothetical protein
MRPDTDYVTRAQACVPDAVHTQWSPLPRSFDAVLGPFRLEIIRVT